MVVAVFLVSCNSDKQASDKSDTEKVSISVVNYPLYYFAKTIGGDHVQVYFPAIEGDPAYWKPSAKQVHHFQQADLILANGAGYEKWMEKVSLPSSRVVVSSRPFKDEWIRIEATVSHSHGPEGEHVHEGTAFTTWLNFKFAQQQAATVYESVKRLLPDKVDEIDANYLALKEQLEGLDQLAATVASKAGKQAILDAHGIYQYFASGYGLNHLSEHLEAHEMPEEHEWLKLEETIDSHRISIMLWEEEPLEDIKKKLEKLNVRISVFIPCGNRPEEGNFIEIMRKNLKDLDLALSSN